MQARPDHTAADVPTAVDPAQLLARRRRLGFAVAVVISLQVIVPTIAFLPPPPQRFGFQMYAARGGVAITVIDGEGARHPFDADPLVGQLRPEIDWRGILPQRVCESVEDASAVLITQFGQDRTVECD